MAHDACWRRGVVASIVRHTRMNEVTLCQLVLVLWVRIPSQYVTSQLGQLSPAFLQGRQIKYQPWLALRLECHLCRWQVTLCDPI